MTSGSPPPWPTARARSSSAPPRADADRPTARRSTARRPRASAGDAAAQAWLAGRARRRPPGRRGPVRGGRRRPRRLTADRVWIIDPLDGTREFGERLDGRRLARRLRGPRRALAPRRRARRRRRRAARLRRDVLVRRAGRPRRRTRPTPSSAAAARSGSPSVAHPPAGGRHAAGGARRRRAGADGLDRRQGRRACSTGPSTPTCTPAASTSGTRRPRWPSRRAAGFVATRLDGSPLVYNQPDPWSPDLVVCHPALAAHLRGLLAGGRRRGARTAR